MSTPVYPNKKVVYIAGPMRGYPEFNFDTFMWVEWHLRDAGYEVMNPARHDLESGFNPAGLTGNETPPEINFDIRDALTWDMVQVLSSDFIVTLPGWADSKGAQAEVATAKAAGIPVWLARPYQTHLTLLESEGEDFRVLIRPEGEMPDWRSISATGPLSFEATIVAIDWTSLKWPTEEPNTETRSTSTTGGQKGRKLAELGAIDPTALYKLAEVAGFGARKYDAFNYLKGYPWSWTFNALMRHALQFWNGEELDPESGLPHITHAAWHALALTSFLERGLGEDDRFKQN